jgi:hypothetical protein
MNHIKTGIPVLIRISTLVCGCALALAAAEPIFAFGAAGQILPATIGDASTVEIKPSSHPLADPERDPAERSARSIECSQKADAQGLQGKIRKHFLHQCKSGS